ncbi:MAG: hypothetical protein WKF96_24685 [Solirubrobacteraceae bacterium]
MSSGGTEAITGVIEKTRRLAHGFRNFTNYRLRILLAADVLTPLPSLPLRDPNHAELGGLDYDMSLPARDRGPNWGPRTVNRAAAVGVV